MVDTQSSNHRYALTPLIGHLDFHPTFDPHSGRLHPEVEGGLINVDYICGWFRHHSPGNLRGELLLLVQQLTFPFGLGPVDDLRLSIGGPMFNVDLSDQPRRQLWQLEFLPPVGCPLLERHVALY